MNNAILLLTMFFAAFLLWNKGLQARFGTLDLETSQTPVVVELFTSQGCSSCPPADKVLAELAAQPNIIALGCHVTYWDRLGWHDTLGQSFCDQRQRDYSAARQSSRVYTPQMVVNGQAEFVGSHKDKVSKNIARAVQKDNVQPITLSKSGNQLTIQLPKLPKMGDYKLWVVGYKTQHSENVRAGELRGHTLNYANGVTTLDTLGSWAGELMAHTFTIPTNNINGIAVISQKINHGEIVAAGKIEF